MLVMNDKNVNDFLKPCISQLEGKKIFLVLFEIFEMSFLVWLGSKVAQTVVVVIMEVNTKEVLERWQFDVCNEQGDGASTDG